MLDNLTDEELLEAQILADPVFFAETYLRSPSDPKKDMLLRNYQKGILRCRHQRRVLRMGRRCVAETDIVFTPKGPLPFKEVALNHIPIWTVDKHKNIVETEDYEVWENGVVPTLEIITISGKTQRVSYNHPIYVYTNEGPKMVKAEDLTGEEWVGVPKKLTIKDTVSIGIDVAYLLGYLTGDGSTSGKSIRFTNKDPRILNHLKEVAVREGITLNKIHGQYEYSLTVPKCGTDSKIQNLVEKHNLRKLSKHKEIPTAIYTAPLKEVAAFLGAYWDCDGWVSQRKTGKKEIGVCSASKKLLEGMRFLLNRFGINPSVRYKEAKFNGKSFDSWVLELRYIEDVKTFFTEIKLHGEKESRKQSILDTFVGESTAWQNRMPKECIHALREEATLQNKSIRSLDSTKEFKLYERSNRKEKALTAASALKRIDIQEDINNDLLWEPLKSITKQSPINTWDISVDKTENFIGNGICLSNTGKTVVLAVEAIWHAFTNADAEVLMVAGYDSQVATIFNLILRMVRDSPEVSQSIRNTRMRPYEIHFKNNSIIMGYVGNNSVRGKCLPKYTQIIMSDLSTKEAGDVKVGDKLFTYNIEGDKGGDQGTVTAVHKNGVKDIYQLEAASDRIIHLTGNHKVYVYGRGWVAAEDVKTQEHFDHAADFVGVVHPSGEAYWTRAKRLTKVGKAETLDFTVEPHHNLIAFNPLDEDKSGFKVKGTHSGGFLIHNSADAVYIDEIDSIPNDYLLEAVLPISTTHSTTSLTISGTPSGRREYFFSVSKNKDLPAYDFKEHHVPSTSSPEWTPQQEAFQKSIMSKAQYEREYLAVFGSSAEGVFKNKHIDANSYVYDYSDLKYNKNNHYILGVDWNESSNGVQAVVLEYVQEAELLLPFNDGKFKDDEGNLIEKEEHNNFLRVFYAAAIDPDDYTNVGAVEFIIELMKKIDFTFCAFDRGHGEANYEMLRLALDTGKYISTNGHVVKATGLRHMIDRTMSIEMGSPFEIIDPITKQVSKASTKNVMVKNAQMLNENGNYVIPAMNLKGVPVEDEEKRLIGQMRSYIVERIGKTGEIYSSTIGIDHRLDALLLASHAFMINNSVFHKKNAEFAMEEVGDPLAVAMTPGWRSNLEKSNVHQPKVGNLNGMTTRDYGDYTGRGEPPEVEWEDNPRMKLIRTPEFKHKSRTTGKRNTNRRLY